MRRRVEKLWRWTVKVPSIFVLISKHCQHFDRYDKAIIMCLQLEGRWVKNEKPRWGTFDTFYMKQWEIHTRRNVVRGKSICSIRRVLPLKGHFWKLLPQSRNPYLFFYLFYFAAASSMAGGKTSNEMWGLRLKMSLPPGVDAKAAVDLLCRPNVFALEVVAMALPSSVTLNQISLSLVLFPKVILFIDSARNNLFGVRQRKKKTFRRPVLFWECIKPRSPRTSLFHALKRATFQLVFHYHSHLAVCIILWRKAYLRTNCISISLVPVAKTEASVAVFSTGPNIFWLICAIESGIELKSLLAT